MITSPHLDGRDRYERVIEAWVDNTHEDTFTHTVRLADDDHAIEVSADCTPSPDYEVRRARARVLRGGADPAVAADFSNLSGTRMVAGFTRRLSDLCGDRPGAEVFVDAAVEVARLARQVAKLPASMTAGLPSGGAQACWDLDARGWADLPDSCFTYSRAGRALLSNRSVTASAGRELYSPVPGARRVFVRARRLRLVLNGRRLHLFHSMHDNVHGFDIHFEVDIDSGLIVATDSVTSRLPYQGLCDEPQARINDLIGQAVDAGLRKRSQPLVGGETGCAQLYDLTIDLLKLLRYTR